MMYSLAGRDMYNISAELLAKIALTSRYYNKPDEPAFKDQDGRVYSGSDINRIFGAAKESQLNG
jgi:hypothetical protein